MYSGFASVSSFSGAATPQHLGAPPSLAIPAAPPTLLKPAVSVTPSQSGASSGKHFRAAAGKVWEDTTLDEWPEDDYRIFVGNLGNDVNADVLGKAFSKYPSFNKAKVVRDKRSMKTKGFGFVSFAESRDMITALKEMNGKYVGNRPVVLKASKWKDREVEEGEASQTLKEQTASGWDKKRQRRYHTHFEPYSAKR
eukprot:TRINITY_DN56075_c0_g1_i1.p1 TRINITY_DN56075_c0_g1~~TRINITY_DN56075_c0_g1_i1.p1  ORF type:complete len:196 (-),score=46.28 TRINITY_DN56075_c0_g1_i1:43-630(-)